MIGLLYKEFIATKSRMFVVFSILHLILISVLALGSNGNGETEVITIYLYSLYFVIVFILIFSYIGIALVKSDNQKQIEYYLSTPIKHKEYIIEKYIFLLGVFAFVTIIMVTEGLIIKNNISIDVSHNMMKNLWKLLPVIIGTAMICMAVEIPVYYIFGVDRGKSVITGFVVIILFVFVGYLFFGDLSVLDELNLSKLLEILNNNKKILRTMQFAVPAGALCLTFISSLVSMSFFERIRK